ncbi:N-acetyl-gamma-glutamyl-phosphate reductase [Sphingomonas colocasiae]|uniref:N-acetyl-gamma-glutamyl-phosphate reductase n=1 Tax=Sphingomonas colocasiae TaxID=1848973 RepID=A0ABS7PL53_9SPHN|nr:N-acetyl-gamma-glutamyl-phosphate reductase [Sphingomonas colocasiae]MBY8821460.1 N-acetyl-gamma-glutamyl-phosphate reductase [Sphingomonas colocasiae]
MTRVFIDGAAGTTGLEIRERLAGRDDLSVIVLSDADRKDAAARRGALNEADAVILCLPDDAAREAVSLIENPDVRVIDASTAHRTTDGWAYGFAEIEPERRTELSGARRISNPGCYPTGFLALVRPLVRAGLIPGDWPFTVNATSGYSGGGKSMIAAFEDAGAPDATDTAFRIYALGLGHKHVAEMQVQGGLAHPPLFMPAVARTYRGMLVEVPLQLRAMANAPSAAALRDALAEAYAGSRLVSVHRGDDPSLLMLERTAGTDRLELFVFANEAAGQVRLVAALDNLGKGAGGAAVQNLNLAVGLDEYAGLRL